MTDCLYGPVTDNDSLLNQGDCRITDYISREAARQCIHKWLADIFGIDEPELTVLDKRINAIPAVDVRPVVHGEWIDKTVQIGFPIAKCSCCGSQAGMFWMNFCPNCGARMDRRTDNG